MSSADRIIHDIQCLPPEEQQKVVNYCLQLEAFDLSNEDQAAINNVKKKPIGVKI
jgi:hypothetical protein